MERSTSNLRQNNSAHRSQSMRFHEDVRKEESQQFDIGEVSEASYKPFVTNQELLQQIMYINFNVDWMYLVTIANIMLLSVYCYALVYDDGQFQNNTSVTLLTGICQVLIVADIVSMVAHRVRKREAARRPYQAAKLIFLALDIISIPTMLISLIPSVFRLPVFKYTRIGFVILRCYRIFKYLYMSSIIGGQNTTTKMFAKYGIICASVIHLSSCILEHMCVDCDPFKQTQNNWYGEQAMQFYLINKTKAKIKPSDIYFLGVHTIVGIFSKVGYAGASPGNSDEAIFVSFISILALFIVSGAFLSAFVTVRVENQRAQYEYFSKLLIIKNNVYKENIGKKLRWEVLNYYKYFWEKEFGIKKSILFESLPATIRNQVNLDKYWEALNQSYIFRDVSEEFQREVASTMCTEIMTKGEIIYVQGERKEAMAYIARGSVQLLSRHDGESPVLSLGAGTLLGELSLLFSYRCKVMVKAESYCVIYYLYKRDLWKLPMIKSKLMRSTTIHKAWQRRMDHTRISSMVSRENNTKRRYLSEVKKKLMTDKEMETYQQRLGGFLYKKNKDSLCSLYILSEMETVRNYDDVFARTTWPWILHPRSQVVVIWDLVILGLITLIAILMPYTIIELDMENTGSKLLALVLPVTSFFYMLDVLCKLFVGVETENGLHVNVSDIISYRLTDIVFLMDIAAAAPLYLINVLNQDGRNSLYYVNMLLKFSQVVKFLTNAEKTLVFNVFVVRIIKYLIFILYSVYLGAVIYICASCGGRSYENCSHNSWVERIMNQPGTDTEKILIRAMYHVLALLSQNASVYAFALHDFLASTVLALFGLVLFLYILSEFTATMILRENLKEWYMELVNDIEKYMEINDTSRYIQQRMRSFLEAQWLVDSGMKSNELFKDLPVDLYKEMQIAKYLHLCMQLPLFKDIEKTLMHTIAQHCKPVFLPPNELIVHEGDYANNIFIIEKGYCEVLTARADKDIIGPMSFFCDLEMLLNKPAKHGVRTITHVSLVMISKNRLQEFLSLYPDIKSNVEDVIAEFENSILVYRVFSEKHNTDNVVKEHIKTKSWFVFSRIKRDPLSRDYEKYFEKSCFHKLLRYLLMRRTFIPDGAFIVRWEVFRAICSIITSIMWPSMFIYMSMESTQAIYNVQYVFDILFICDIYLRMHGCYYNEKGLLVSHPLMTSRNYLTSSFLIDFIAAFPIFKVLVLVTGDSDKSIRIGCYLMFFKLLQLYRLPGAMFIINRDSFKRTTLLESCLLFIPLCLAFINAIACLFIITSSELKVDDHIYMTTIPSEDSWFDNNRANNLVMVEEHYALHIYWNALYWVTSNTLTLGITYSPDPGTTEILLYASCILIGYLLFSYVIMFLTNHQANINLNLTAIQNQTKQLLRYMKRENIPKQLQTETVQYFDIVWRRSNGIRQSEVLKRCHSGLTQDWVLTLYGPTLSKVPIFNEMTNTFYKLFGSNLIANNFLGGATVIRINDIIDQVYIVHRGFVTVLGPDGSVFDFLSQGSMFGNIDDVPNSRSMLSIVATRPVDLVCINTVNMYNIFRNYPVVASRLRTSILINCLSYVASEHSDFEDIEHKQGYNRTYSAENMLITRTSNIDILYKVMSSSIMKYLLMLLSFTSICMILAMIAFKRKLIIYFYTIDALLFLKICVSFLNPYINNVGEVIKDKRKIVSNYIHTSNFIVEIIALIPLEVCALAASEEKQEYYFNWLRINRILRLHSVYVFFQMTYSHLHVNMLLVKMTTVTLYTLLLVHTIACILYYVSCKGDECTETSWLYYDHLRIYNWREKLLPEKILGCVGRDSDYICSLYYAVSLITLTGYPFPRPHTYMDKLASAIIAMLARIIVAILLGHIFALLRHLSYDVVIFNYRYQTLKRYLKQSCISPYLTKKVLEHMNYLWIWEKGLQLPALIMEAPPYLNEAMKMAAYGHHISQNMIFEFCHPDFLRLLVRKLKVENYFQGDLICQQGDLNETMYFIHMGNVHVIRTDNNQDTLVDDLTDPDSFGLLQGLFPSTAHTHTFQSTTVTVVVTLKRSDWFHLISFFPASKFLIFDNVETLCGG